MMFKSDYYKALDDYKRARRSANIQALLARLTGDTQEMELLSYEEVRRQLKAIKLSAEHLAEVPLDAIVGSVGRYHDFTKKFLPKKSIDQNRWARVMAETHSLSGLSPIDVYKIGEVFFVKDGNHRVSVARQMGNTTIQAYITEVETKVDLSPDFKPDDLIIKTEFVNFLEKTKLDHLKPEADLNATKPGAYPTLLENIGVHQYFMGIEQQREIPYPEAVSNWYEVVFFPVVNIIRRRGLLRNFPDRTETDLYLWAADHRAELEQEIGWDIGPEAALTDLAEKQSPLTKQPIRDFFTGQLKRIIPDVFLEGPPPGTWREKLSKMTVLEYLFSDLIVALDNSPNSWNALDQAIIIARMENSRIHGIHVHPKVTETSRKEHLHLQQEFESRCLNADCNQFDFLVSAGEISKTITEHARFADLVVLPLNHPPGDKPINRLSSGLTTLIRSCPIPILTVPRKPTQLKKIVLAYDGSFKAIEAMYLAVYLGSQMQSSLKVLTSTSGLEDPISILDEAKAYLSPFPIESKYILSKSSIPDEIGQIHRDGEVDLLLIGGYGGGPMLDIMLGSVVDQILREIQLPILICR